MAGRREAMESATENTPPMAGLCHPQGWQSHPERAGAKAPASFGQGSGKVEMAR